MKKALITLLTAAVFAVGCQYDDSALTDEINSIKSRVTALEQTCSLLNTNVSSLQKAVEAMEKLYTVKDLKTTEDGYVIVFSNGKEITIKNGTNGTNGANGVDGKDGKDGATPQIGVKQENGVWYWTVNGEWLLNDKGEKVTAQTSATIPTFKVEDGYWYVKVGNGDWERIEGSNTGSSDIKVTKDDENVYITAGGTTVAIPLAGFVLTAEKTEVDLKAGASIEIPYVLRGGDATVKFKVETTGGVKSAVTKTDDKSGKIKITAPADMPQTADVCITAVKNSSSEICSQLITVRLEITASISTDKITFSASEDLSSVVKLTCNGPWRAESDNEAFTVSPASGEGNADITITAAANTGEVARTGTISIIVGDDIFSISVSQAKPAPMYDFDGCIIADHDYLINQSGAGSFAKLKIEAVDGDPYSLKLTATGDNPWFFTTPLKKNTADHVLTFNYKVESANKISFRVYVCSNGAFNASYRLDFGGLTSTVNKGWRWNVESIFANWGFGKAGDMLRIDLIGMRSGDVLYFNYLHFREVREGDANGEFAL